MAIFDNLKENSLLEHTHESLNTDNYRAILQKDGNFVIFDSKGTIVFDAKACKNGINNTKDYVVEYNSTSGNSYRKWNSGYLEVWKSASFTTAIQKQWGGDWCICGQQSGLEYPVPFIESPTVIMDVKTADTSNSYVIVIKSTDGTKTHTPSFALARQGTAESAKYGLQVYAAGRWK